MQLLCQFCLFVNSEREGTFQRFSCLLFHIKSSSLSRRLAHIFVHPKSSQRYVELFCLLFKLLFSYLSYPLLLFPLLFCLFFKLPFPHPFRPSQLFSLLFCLLFMLLFFIHLTRYYCSLCYSVFFLSCLFPTHFAHHNCSPCYSVSFLCCFFLFISLVTTVPSVILSFF